MSSAAPSRQGSGAGDGDQSSTIVTELTIWQRGAAAGVASLLSSLALNPMDVVKVGRTPPQAISFVVVCGRRHECPACNWRMYWGLRWCALFSALSMPLLQTRMQTQSAASMFGSGAKAAGPPAEGIMALRYRFVT